MEFNERTKAQIVNIQINTIMEYLIKFLKGNSVNPKDVDNIHNYNYLKCLNKIKKCFKIVENNNSNNNINNNNINNNNNNNNNNHSDSTKDSNSDN